MPKQLRVAMLGMGNMGRSHAGHLLEMEGIELAAMCSSPVEDAAHYAKEHALTCPVYDDFDIMLREQQFDILYVCLPPFAHCGQVEAAAAKKVNIFIEKPIAINVERAVSMEKAVRENGVFSQVGYHMRFGGAVKRLRGLMEDGVAGKPLLYTANYECNSLHTPWWIDVTKCGGQVFEQIIHLYDMAYYLLGPATSVSGYIANLDHQDVPGYTVEDTSIWVNCRTTCKACRCKQGYCV